MLQEPLLVVGAFYILFFTVIVYVRLDFSITKVCMMKSPVGIKQFSQLLNCDFSYQ